MKSVILSTATRYLLPLLLLFSVFALLRGHNEPGGGFVGGLVASAAFTLFALAHDVERARAILPLNPRLLIAVGLLIAVTSGLIGMLFGEPFMTTAWDSREIPVVGKMGTPLLFDVGVYLTVMGVALTIIFSLAEE
jgi:multicomponent Na+:H+ antiporter subunit B